MELLRKLTKKLKHYMQNYLKYLEYGLFIEDLQLDLCNLRGIFNKFLNFYYLKIKFRQEIINTFSFIRR